MRTTFGYYGLRSRWEAMDLDKEFLSKKEQEKRTRAMAMAMARKAHDEGRKTASELQKEQDLIDRSKGFCPKCFMLRAIDGSCNC